MHIFHLNVGHSYVAGVGNGISVGNGLAHQDGRGRRGISFNDGKIWRGRAIVGDNATDVICRLDGEVDWNGAQRRNRRSPRIVVGAGHRLRITRY